MSIALPAANAAKLVRPEFPLEAFISDGEAQMSFHYLSTSAMQRLPIVVLVLNNSGFLSIRDGQDGSCGPRSRPHR